MKVVIAHGSFGNPHENWMPWLVEECNKLGVEFLTPTFPTPEHQKYKDWKRILDIYKEFGCFSEDTVFIGHSCGAVFLAKYIIEEEMKCRAYISLAGYNQFFSGDALMDGLNSSFYLSMDELKKIPSLVQDRISIYADDDPFIPQLKLKEFANVINSKEFIVSNGGHLNKSAGLTSFELLLNQIKAFI